MKKIQVHPEARSEAKRAFDWYWDRSPSAALEFDDSLRKGYSRIRKNPNVFPPYLHGTRRAIPERYPFSVVFRVRLHNIQIVAVAHAKRRPGYWARD